MSIPLSYSIPLRGTPYNSESVFKSWFHRHWR